MIVKAKAKLRLHSLAQYAFILKVIVIMNLNYAIAHLQNRPLVNKEIFKGTDVSIKLQL